VRGKTSGWKWHRPTAEIPDMVQIRQATIIDAPIEQVWDILRDFNGHDRWHPAIAASHIEGNEPSTRVGAVRNFRLRDGSMLREQLLALSDKDRSFRYCLLEAPIPLMNYVAEVRLRPVTDGDATFWEWSSRFDPPLRRRDELTALVTRDIYQAGFAAIRQLLRRGWTADARPTSPSSSGQSYGNGILSPSVAGEERSAQRSNRASEPVAATNAGRPEAARSSAAALPSSSPRFAASAPAAGETTRAIVVEQYGGPDVMQLREVPLPPLRSDEVRIRHTAIGVNYIDVYCRTGFFTLLTPPGTPGMEAAGVVEAAGRDVAGLETGDRVAYAGPPLGAYSERRNMNADLLVRLSHDISDETAAAGLLKGVTASFLLQDIGRVEPGMVVLIHAAAGGVGQLLAQWARHLGATVIATTSSEDKARLARSLGAHHVINYSHTNFADAVMEITRGRGTDVIYDAVGRDTLAGSIAALAIRGHLVSFGQASGPIGEWDIDKFAAKSITFSRPNYAHYSDTPERLGKHVRSFFQVLRQGVVQLAPPTRFRLDRAADAHRHIESRQSTGSTVLLP
jgi:NADPH:quinone reductase-like Zn-dependent oxidoreductase